MAGAAHNLVPLHVYAQFTKLCCRTNIQRNLEGTNNITLKHTGDNATARAYCKKQFLPYPEQALRSRMSDLQYIEETLLNIKPTRHAVWQRALLVWK